jgi:hypothetical protein
MSPLTVQAAADLAAFQQRNEPERIQDAGDRLQEVMLTNESDPQKRRALRKDTLELWLLLFDTIDGSLNTRFEPRDMPLVSVQPPPSNGVVFPPGVDPSLLKDPAARKEYERRIVENQQKAENYQLQVKLRRLDERLWPKLEGFIRAAYSTSTEPDDRREVLDAIQTILKNPQRAERLRKVV